MVLQTHGAFKSPHEEFVALFDSFKETQNEVTNLRIKVQQTLAEAKATNFQNEFNPRSLYSRAQAFTQVAEKLAGDYERMQSLMSRIGAASSLLKRQPISEDVKETLKLYAQSRGLSENIGDDVNLFIQDQSAQAEQLGQDYDKLYLLSRLIDGDIRDLNIAHTQLENYVYSRGNFSSFIHSVIARSPDSIANLVAPFMPKDQIPAERTHEPVVPSAPTKEEIHDGLPTYDESQAYVSRALREQREMKQAFEKIQSESQRVQNERNADIYNQLAIVPYPAPFTPVVKKPAMLALPAPVQHPIAMPMSALPDVIAAPWKTEVPTITVTDFDEEIANSDDNQKDPAAGNSDADQAQAELALKIFKEMQAQGLVEDQKEESVGERRSSRLRKQTTQNEQPKPAPKKRVVRARKIAPKAAATNEAQESAKVTQVATSAVANTPRATRSSARLRNVAPVAPKQTETVVRKAPARKPRVTKADEQNATETPSIQEGRSTRLRARVSKPQAPTISKAQPKAAEETAPTPQTTRRVTRARANAQPQVTPTVARETAPTPQTTRRVTRARANAQPQVTPTVAKETAPAPQTTRRVTRARATPARSTARRTTETTEQVAPRRSSRIRAQKKA